MVAETALVTEAIEGTEGFVATIDLFLLQEEGGIVDVGPHDARGQQLRDKDVVEGMPVATETVGAAGMSLQALGRTTDVLQSCTLQQEQRGIVGIVIEIACHDGTCLSYGGEMVNERAGYLQPIGPCLQLTAVAAGGMDDIEVKGVARHDQPLDIEDVARGALVLHGGNGEMLVAEGQKAERLVEQGYIEAPDIGRLCLDREHWAA